MSYSLASRYSEVFKLMANPYSLVILDHLFENNVAVTAQSLVDVTNQTKAKISALCEELYDLGIVDRDYEGDEPTYKVTNNRYANFMQKIIEYID